MDDAEFEADATHRLARIEHAIRIRHFPTLGWSIVVVPMDITRELGAGALERGAARMLVGTWWGFEPEEVTSLRARNLALDDESARPCWVLAITAAAIARRSIGAAT